MTVEIHAQTRLRPLATQKANPQVAASPQNAARAANDKAGGAGEEASRQSAQCGLDLTCGNVGALRQRGYVIFEGYPAFGLCPRTAECPQDIG